jgi:hypothetical protein
MPSKMLHLHLASTQEIDMRRMWYGRLYVVELQTMLSGKKRQDSGPD